MQRNEHRSEIGLFKFNTISVFLVWNAIVSSLTNPSIWPIKQRKRKVICICDRLEKAAASRRIIQFWREEITGCDWLTVVSAFWRLTQKFDSASASPHNNNIDQGTYVIFGSAANLLQHLLVMEETDRDQKKKSIIPQLPSCFMSPETPGNLLRDRLTPCFDSPSSIFPTPPCSQEKESISHFHSLALDEIPRLNFELDESDQEKSMQQSLHRSPLMPEDRVIGRLIGIKSVDFISDLLAVNGNKICQRICSYLEPLELCRQDFNFFFVVFEIGRYVVHNRCQYESCMNENHLLRSLAAALN